MDNFRWALIYPKKFYSILFKKKNGTEGISYSGLLSSRSRVRLFSRWGRGTLPNNVTTSRLRRWSLTRLWHVHELGCRWTHGTTLAICMCEPASVKQSQLVALASQCSLDNFHGNCSAFSSHMSHNHHEFPPCTLGRDNLSVTSSSPPSLNFFSTHPIQMRFCRSSSPSAPAKRSNFMLQLWQTQLAIFTGILHTFWVFIPP